MTGAKDLENEHKGIEVRKREAYKKSLPAYTPRVFEGGIKFAFSEARLRLNSDIRLLERSAKHPENEHMKDELAHDARVMRAAIDALKILEREVAATKVGGDYYDGGDVPEDAGTPDDPKAGDEDVF